MHKDIVLGPKMTLDEFVEVARCGSKVEFSEEYAGRVEKTRRLVDGWAEEGGVMYCITTGFGVLCTKTISKEENAKLQRNIILTHSVSVGEPLSIEQTRAVMLMVLQNAGQDYSGIRLEVLEMYRQFLNLGLTPFAPQEGSVGYLNIEAHIALVLIGKGKAYIKGELLPAREALDKIGLKPIELSSKEGLVLVKKPGLNSGLMIPQYSQAGILNDMRILCHPATIDNIPTCGNQEDYVSMGYNACKKGILVAEKLEYILAIELLSVYQAHQFIQEGLEPGTVTKAVLEEIKSKVPVMEEDMYLHPYIEELKDIIHSGRIIDLVEEKVGKLV
ncbi:MAG TPA: aromatic amino acid lyase [Clostridia bacterium]|nr:aromatic amino acid lyase [Clostridia bacterium]